MNFDLENTRRDLIAMRVKHGANSPRGHACSNLIEQTQSMVGYVRPAWATHECQTLAWAMSQQIRRLAMPKGEL